MKDFLTDVADVLEVGAIAAEDDFRAVEGWCSLKGFSLMILLEQRYGKVFTVAEFLACRTVADLARAAGVAA